MMEDEDGFGAASSRSQVEMAEVDDHGHVLHRDGMDLSQLEELYRDRYAESRIVRAEAAAMDREVAELAARIVAAGGNAPAAAAKVDKDEDAEHPDRRSVTPVSGQFGHAQCETRHVHRPVAFHLQWSAAPHLRQYFRNGVLFREKEERRTTWSELFYDLVFVVMIAHLAIELEHHNVPVALAHLSLLFVAIWQIWSTTLTFLNLFETEDVLTKVLYFLSFVAVFGIGVHGKDDFDATTGSNRAFTACSYLLGRYTVTVFRARAAFYIPVVRRAVVVETIQEIVASLPLLVSVFLDSVPFAWIWFWVVTLGLDILFRLMPIHWFVASRTNIRMAINVEHFAERYAIFGIVVLGELVAALLYDSEDSSILTYFAAAAGLAISFSFQVIYYEVDARAGAQKQHAFRNGSSRGIIWSTLHLVLSGAVILSAVGLKLLLLATFDTHPHKVVAMDRIIFCDGTALYFYTMAAMVACHEGNNERRFSNKQRVIFRSVTATIIVLLGAAGNALSAHGYVFIVSGIVAVYSLIEMHGAMAVRTADERRAAKEKRLGAEARGLPAVRSTKAKRVEWKVDVTAVEADVEKEDEKDDETASGETEAVPPAKMPSLVAPKNHARKQSLG